MTSIQKITPSTLPSAPLDIDMPLIRRMANGESQALEMLMDRHMKKIHGTAYRMLGDQMQAEDVTQMVFLNIWNLAPKWAQGQARVLSYLYKVCTHRCLDILRKKKESLPGELPDQIDQQPSALNLIENRETAERVQSAIAQLPDNQRAAINLFYYEHQSLKMAAETLEISPSAFESLLRRARKSLKSHLTTDPASPMEPLS